MLPSIPPGSTRATFFNRTVRPSGAAFTITFATCSGSVSLPGVLMVNWNRRPFGSGDLADRPAGHLDVLPVEGRDHVHRTQSERR